LTKHNFESMDREDAIRTINECAEDAGIILDLVECEFLQDLDFLKTTPVYNTAGEIEAIDCLGSLLKSLGSCSGAHLPGLTKDQKRKFVDGLYNGYTTLQYRAALYTSEVYKGKCHSGDHVILDGLRSRIIQADSMDISDTSFYKDSKMSPIQDGDHVCGRIDEDEIAIRYRTCGAFMSELGDMLKGARFGEIICHPVLSNIFKRDYEF